MQELLIKDKPYLVFVEKMEAKVKRPTFEVKGKTYWNYMVDIRLKDDRRYTVEYASPTPLPDAVVHGSWQWMRCIKPSDFGCEVVPCDPPGEERAPAGNSLPKITNDGIKPEERMNTPVAGNGPLQKQANERIMSMAMSYAKDLMVAEISIRHAGSAVTEDDISKVASWGVKLYNAMEERGNF